MTQELPLNGFKSAKDTSQFHNYFIKSYNEEIDEGYFFRFILTS